MVATGRATAPSKAVPLLAGALELRNALRSAMAAMISQYGVRVRGRYCVEKANPRRSHSPQSSQNNQVKQRLMALLNSGFARDSSKGSSKGLSSEYSVSVPYVAPLTSLSKNTQ